MLKSWLVNKPFTAVFMILEVQTMSASISDLSKGGRNQNSNQNPIKKAHKCNPIRFILHGFLILFYFILRQVCKIWDLLVINFISSFFCIERLCFSLTFLTLDRQYIIRPITGCIYLCICLVLAVYFYGKYS